MAISAKVSVVRRRFERGKGEVSRNVVVTDAAHPGIEASFGYAPAATGWRLAAVHISQDSGVSPTLTASALRDMPLARWQRTADAHLRAQEERRRSSDTAPANASALRLAEVAGAYRANLAAGLKDPVAAIARDYDVKPATARSWVHRARKAGLLGEALSRAAGEDIGRETES